MARHPAVSLLFLSLLTLSSSDDTSVLLSLSSSLSPRPPSWLPSSPPCSWSGIKCTSSNLVTSISLPSLSLSGTLPPSLSSLSSLQTLRLGHNALSGPIPSLSSLSLLQELYLEDNGFTSLPPSFLSNLSLLQTLSLNDNPNLPPWTLPEDLSHSTSIQNIYISNASLTGSIPDIFDSFPNLQNLRLSYNNLSGPLPGTFAGSQISNLWLNNQDLSGGIEVLASMPQLSQVWLHANAFSGPIPDLSNCQNLFDLQLRDNLFTGPVPTSLLTLTHLSNITLQNNKLQGPVPNFPPSVTVTLGTTNSFCRETAGLCDNQVTALLSVAAGFGYPMSLAQSWTGNDACNKWSLVNCDASGNVTLVNFGKQKFSGFISPGFANLTMLKSLYLNDNNLTGVIPDSLATLSQLQVLDVSNNNLSGAIPKFSQTGLKLTTTGNPFIGKDLDGGKGSPSSGSDSKTPGGGSKGASKKSDFSAGTIVGIVVAVVVFVVVLFVMIKCYLVRRDKSFGRVEVSENGTEMTKIMGINGLIAHSGVPSEMQSQCSGDHGEMPTFDGGNIVIPIHVLRDVTDNFSEKNILGRGGFGVVYKGELNDGTKIAVKRMESGAMGNKGMKEFQAEIAVLTKVRHRHLVALLGYCVNESERLLVYEYMPQGTLTQHLFEWGELGYAPLTWKQRVTIALDMARGVEYLHSLAQTSFIHRDLKPSNILLGDNMRAKVADFGLVKHAPDGNYSLETRLAGTFGYLAPEYAATGRVTTKVDVYAFGVVLMEIVTGRKALDETAPDEMSHLVSWFRRVLINKDNIRKAIDQTLNPDDETFDNICKIAELAGHCTAREPYQRPDMGHAVNVLGPLVEHWKPSTHEDEDVSGIDLHMSLPQTLLRWQADEGTSTMFDHFSYSQTQSSIPPNPSGFPNTFSTSDGR